MSCVTTRWYPIPTNDKKDTGLFWPPITHLKSVSYNYIIIIFITIIIILLLLLWYAFVVVGFYHLSKSGMQILQMDGWSQKIFWGKKCFQNFVQASVGRCGCRGGWKYGRRLNYWWIPTLRRGARGWVCVWVGGIHSCSFGFHSTALGRAAAFIHGYMTTLVFCFLLHFLSLKTNKNT